MSKYAHKGVRVGVPGLGVEGITWLLHDDFRIDRASGEVDGTPAEPGPGTRTVEGTASIVTIESGKLTFSGAAAADTPVYYGPFEILMGRAVRWDIGPRTNIANDEFGAGLTVNAGINTRVGVRYNDSTSLELMAHPNPVTDDYETGTNDTHRFIALMHWRAGGILLYRAVADPTADNQWAGTYRILFISHYLDGDTEYYFSAYGRSTFNGTVTVDNVEMIDLGGEYGKKYGLAEQWVADPDDGETLSPASADGWVEVTWNAVAAEVVELMVRRTDDDNCWIVRNTQSTGVTALIKKESGVETEIDSVVGALTPTLDYRILVLLDDEVIAVSRHRDNAQPKIGIRHESATYNKTVKGVKVAGSTNLGDLVVWPLEVSVA